MEVQEWIAIAPGMLVPVVSVGFVLFYVLYYGPKQRAQAQAATVDYQAGAIAQKLGIRVERGNPNQNLFVTGRHNYEGQHFDVLLRGERNGVPLEVVYYKEINIDQGIFSTTINRAWEARITARTAASFGHFEATLRSPSQWNRVRP